MTRAAEGTGRAQAITHATGHVQVVTLATHGQLPYDATIHPASAETGTVRVRDEDSYIYESRHVYIDERGTAYAIRNPNDRVGIAPRDSRLQPNAAEFHPETQRTPEIRGLPGAGPSASHGGRAAWAPPEHENLSAFCHPTMAAMAADRSRRAMQGESSTITDEDSQYDAEADSQGTAAHGGGEAGVGDDQRRANQQAASASLESLYAEIDGSGAVSAGRPAMAPPNSASEHATEIAKHRRVIEIFPYTGPKIDPSTFPKGYIPYHNSTLMFPEALPKVTKKGREPYSAITTPPNYTPMIQFGSPNDFTTVQHWSNWGGRSKHKSRTAAIVRILQYYTNECMPEETLCLNCFTHHRTPDRPTTCPHPRRDFAALICACNSLPESDAHYYAYSACSICGKEHPPVHESECMVVRRREA